MICHNNDKDLLALCTKLANASLAHFKESRTDQPFGGFGNQNTVADGAADDETGLNKLWDVNDTLCFFEQSLQ